MIPDEIIRRRVPPTYAHRIPRSELTNPEDLAFVDFDRYSSQLTPGNETNSNNPYDIDAMESQTVKADKGIDKLQMVSPNVLPWSYARFIATDRYAAASEIRKYLSSSYVNSVRNSSYIESKRRLARFSHSF